MKYARLYCRVPTRPLLLSTLFALAGVGPAPTTILAQDDFSKVEIKVTKAAGHVYMLEGSGGNIGVSVGDDGIVIVDDQFAPLAPKIKAALKGISDKPVKFVLNTHFHGDHTGGNSQFGKDATIVAHENVRKRLAAPPQGASGKANVTPKEALPVITFNDRATVHLNGEDIQAIHFPAGHTDGDSVIFFTQSKVVHMGDDFVTYGFPFVDVSSGGTVSGMISGLEKVLSLIPAEAKIIPGHGPLSTPADLQKFVEMLKDTRSLVARAAQEGQTPEQMKKSGLLDKYRELGTGFIKTDNWIDVLFSDIKRASANATPYQNHGHANERASTR